MKKLQESLQNSSLFHIQNCLGLWLELFLLPENQKQTISELISQQKIRKLELLMFIVSKEMKIATPCVFQMYNLLLTIGGPLGNCRLFEPLRNNLFFASPPFQE